MTGRCILVAALCLCAASVFVQAATAAPKIVTVCASGCGFTTIQGAISDSTTNDGDEILVSPGTYGEISVSKRLTIEGQPGEPMPVIASTGDDHFTVLTGVDGTVLQHLDIRAGGVNATALQAEAGTTASDVRLTATGADGTCADLRGTSPSTLGPNVTATDSGSTATCVEAGLYVADTVTGATVSATGDGSYGLDLENGATLTNSQVSGTQEALVLSGGTAHQVTADGGVNGIEVYRGDNLVTDSVVTSTAADGHAVLTDFGSAPVHATLRNVTAIATGPGSHGLEATAWEGPSSYRAGSIDARNVIVRGAAGDVVGNDAPNPCPMGETCESGIVTISYSNFVTHTGPVVSPVDGPHDQSQDPLFVNGTPGPSEDFHLASAASPVIGAGIADPSDGSTDRDGIAHPNPPSIGAYEFTGVSAPPGGAASPQPLTPTISSIHETNSVFVVGKSATPLTGQTSAARHKRGTVFSFQLDQPSTVTIAIRTRRPGRRVGRRCAPPSKRLRKKRSCKRTVTLMKLSRSAHAGLNKVPFSGRVHRKALKPGRYQAVFTAKDSAGSSKPATLRFRIVRR